ncbi:MAG: acetate--CoA ligase [Candidatus Bathyarchaeia archaeon]
MSKPLEWETTDRVLEEERIFHPTADILDNANITRYMREKGFQSWDQLYKWSIENKEIFWAETADELFWFDHWKNVLEWNPPYAKWFVGAKTNMAYNCLDRHMNTATKDRVAFYWEGEDGTSQSVTYSKLYSDVNRFASALLNLGIGRGDRVTIYLPRIMEAITAMLATARIGAIHSVVFSGFSPQALQARINGAESKAVVTADGYTYRGKLAELKKNVDDALGGCPTVEKVIVAKRANNPVNMSRGRDVFWDESTDEANDNVPCEVMDSEDILYLLHSSGTTGIPKGAIHVHGGYMVGIYATMKFVFDLKDKDIYYCTADPGWVTGHSYIVYGPLCAGAASVFYEGPNDYPDPSIWWKLVEKYKITILYTTPTAIRGLMRFGEQWPAKHSLDSLRLLGTVGEPINPEAWIWYHKNIGYQKCPIVDTWWMTETGMQLITPTPMTPLRPGYNTLPFLGIEPDILTKDGKQVEQGKGGYLVIKAPWPAMLRGLYKDPDRYEQLYWKTIPGNVFFTGDAATRDKDGYFRVQGRVDDVIKKAGHRLGSIEIESTLVSHPKVAEAAAIGKPDTVKGEAIKVFVIVKAGIQPSEQLKEELRKHVRETIGAIASPDELEIVNSLPKTRSGKIMRRLLKARETGMSAGDISTLED